MAHSSLTGGPKAIYFRLDPNSMDWQYRLNTAVKDTYGGRVVQLLSTNIDSLTIQMESGRGGAAYMRQVVKDLRDLALWQRDTQKPVTFTYSPRNIKLAVYVTSVSLRDSLENVTFPITMSFKIQEDINGNIQGGLISAELDRLHQGIGWIRNEVNEPAKGPQSYSEPLWKTTATGAGAAGAGGPMIPGSTGAGDDYPYRGREGTDPWRFFYGECVSFACWRVRSRTKYKDFVNFWRGQHFGNAMGWDEAARGAGIPVDKTPTVNCIAQHNRGKYGHVAHVVAVNTDGTITVDEYNHAGRHIYGQRRVQPSAFDNYIHFER